MRYRISVLILLVPLLCATRFVQVLFAPHLPIAATDWSAAFVLWRVEESTGATRVNSGSACGTTQSDCDLSERAGRDIDQDGTNYQEGSYSAQFDGSAEWIDCDDSSCGGSTKLDPSGDFTYGIHLRPDGVGAAQNIMGKYQTTNDEGYRMLRLATSPYKLGCEIVNPSGADVQITMGDTAANTWDHAACRFDDSADELEIFENGVAGGSPATYTGACCDNADEFQIGTVADSSADFIGRLDEGWLIRVALTAAEICRIAHCNVRGVLCACDRYAPALYASCSTDADCQTGGAPNALCDTGSNTCRGHTISCTPSPCNAAAPS